MNETDPNTTELDGADQQSRTASNRRRVIIAGGTGFIGRRLSAVLGGAGFDVIVLTRSTPRPPIGPVHFVQWQGTDDGESWRKLLDGAHAVVNLCGETVGGPRWTDARKAYLMDSRIIPTQALVSASNAATTPPAVFVQASGVGYYGTGVEAFTESSARGSDFLADLAGRWEAPLEDLREEVRPVICRLGVVLAKKGGALTQMLMPFRMFVGGPIASGNQWLPWIHLHDAAAALALLIDDSASRGIYNLTAPNPVRNVDFAQLAGKAIGRPSWMFTPRVVLKLLLGEQSTLLCDGQQVLPQRLQEAQFEFTYPVLAEAFESLI